MTTHKITPLDRKIYLTCASLGALGASDDVILDYVKTTRSSHAVSDNAQDDKESEETNDSENWMFDTLSDPDVRISTKKTIIGFLKTLCPSPEHIHPRYRNKYISIINGEYDLENQEK